jgi:fructose-bisphosphate aldolase class I
MGARFAKWRAVITIGESIPSQGCIDANAHALARYAAICQAGGLVPIVEPEVLMEGGHDLARCADVTERVLRSVFVALAAQRVSLEGMLLKPNMVLPGSDAATQDDADAVADATVTCLLRTVPGGQSGPLASARLNAMNLRFAGRLPWALTFSFSRAIQQPALELWRGDEAKVSAAQNALLRRAELNRAARRGEYSATMETSAA